MADQRSRRTTHPVLLGLILAVVLLCGRTATAQPAATGKPNIVIIWGDDIGITDVSAYSHGLMGFQTPNIDRVAHDGVMFTDYYGEQSCTAGRAAFLTGQSVFRTGNSKVGLPGADVGLQKEDPTIAELLKPLGYATGQFGKNHLGDLNKYLPTVHGFDEFYGNLYHLNAEEEPEQRDYPKNPAFRAKYGPRGVMHSFATDVDDPTVDPRFGRVGKQRIEDTGPLTKKRMGRSTTTSPRVVRRSSSSRSRPASQFSPGSTSPTCTSARVPSPRALASRGVGRASIMT
jgi:arylsulfatase A-like enzyme